MRVRTTKKFMDKMFCKKIMYRKFASCIVNVDLKNGILCSSKMFSTQFCTVIPKGVGPLLYFRKQLKADNEKITKNLCE